MRLMFDALKRLCYNAVMSEVSENKKRRGPRQNKPLWFLYGKCRLIKPYTIGKISYIPSFQNALLEYENSLDDLSIYIILKYTYLRIMDENGGKGFEHGTAVMNEVSKAVTGDPKIWRVRA